MRPIHCWRQGVSDPVLSYERKWRGRSNRHSNPQQASLRDIPGNYRYPCFPAMISCNVATCLANAPRPAAVAVTVVCGFLPTKAFSTET